MIKPQCGRACFLWAHAYYILKKGGLNRLNTKANFVRDTLLYFYHKFRPAFSGGALRFICLYPCWIINRIYSLTAPAFFPTGRLLRLRDAIGPRLSAPGPGFRHHAGAGVAAAHRRRRLARDHPATQRPRGQSHSRRLGRWLQNSRWDTSETRHFTFFVLIWQFMLRWQKSDVGFAVLVFVRDSQHDTVWLL